MEEQETTEHPSLKVARKPQEKKRKAEPVRPIINLSQLEEKLNKVLEQTDLAGIQEQLNTIQTQLSTLIDLMKQKVDIDAKELELMDLAKKKLEKL